MSSTTQGSDRRRIALLALITVVGIVIVGGLLWKFGGSAGSDAFYDKSLENKILPPGVRPGETPPPGPGGSK